MQLQKFDELDALIKGILYAETHNRTECYYYENASDIKWVDKSTSTKPQLMLAAFQFKSKISIWFFATISIHSGERRLRCERLGRIRTRQLQTNFGYELRWRNIPGSMLLAHRLYHIRGRFVTGHSSLIAQITPFAFPQQSNSPQKVTTRRSTSWCEIFTGVTTNASASREALSRRASDRWIREKDDQVLRKKIWVSHLPLNFWLSKIS